MRAKAGSARGKLNRQVLRGYCDRAQFLIHVPATLGEHTQKVEYLQNIASRGEERFLQ
jgi:hypothetical protein